MSPDDRPSSYRAIENLIATYAELVDGGDFAGVGILLADATYTGSAGSVNGRDAIEKLLRDSLIVYDDGTPRTKHVTTNVAIEVDEEAGTAVSRSYFTVLQALPDLALQPIVSGRYHDRFAPRRAVALRGETRPNRSRRRREPPSAPHGRRPVVLTRFEARGGYPVLARSARSASASSSSAWQLCYRRLG